MRKRWSRSTCPNPETSFRSPNPKQLSLSTETLRSFRSIAEAELEYAWGGRGSCSALLTGCG
jgi:hypothetical protein